MFALKCSKHNLYRLKYLKIISRGIKTVDKLEENLTKIRNIGVIAHIDAGFLFYKLNCKQF